MILKQYKNSGKYWDPLGSIIPTVKVWLKYRFRFTTRLCTPYKSRKKEVEDFIDKCIEIAWAEEEVEKWMTKQAIRCLRRGDDDRASCYEQRTWKPFKRRRFYDKKF